MRWPALWYLVVTLMTVQAGGCPRPQKNDAQGGKAHDFSLLLLAELRGQVEPCGCTSDPLGDLARTSALIDKVQNQRPAVLIDGGSTLYGETSPEKRGQDELKANLIATVLPKLGLKASGLGPADLSLGTSGVRFARQALNIPASSGVPLEAPKLIELGGAKIGILGVVDPKLLVPLGIAAQDPVPLARNAVFDLKQSGAQLMVVIAHMTRPAARSFVQSVPGIDIVLVGHAVPEPHERRPTVEVSSSTYLLSPFGRGQSVLRVDLHLEPGAGPRSEHIADAIGEARAAERLDELDRAIEDIEAKVAAWEKDPSADLSFVTQKRRELEALTAEREDLRRSPHRAPARGSYLVISNLPIKKSLPCDAEIQAAKTELDRAVGALNLAAAQHETVPSVPEGGAGYAGHEECGFCHKKAVEFWRGTRHAHAWETLEELGKHLDRDCVGCHVTGWLEPGGSTLGHNELLRDVQCEVCHGPASLHVDADGKERPKSLVLRHAESRCVQACHTPEHSDTFELKAYLRDVTGPGHGEAFRAQLGDGHAGANLRQEARERAGAAIGEGCRK